MRISHINNTSKMFTMADIDFVQYILWCCPAVTVVQHHRGNKCFIQLYRVGEGYASSSSPYFVVLLEGSINIIEYAAVFYVNCTAKSWSKRYSFPPGFSIFRELEVHPITLLIEFIFTRNEKRIKISFDFIDKKVPLFQDFFTYGERFSENIFIFFSKVPVVCIFPFYRKKGLRMKWWVWADNLYYCTIVI